MIFHEGKLLLLQKNDAEGLHHWEFPGGGLRFTEDFEAGLRREVSEETGLSIALEAPAGILELPEERRPIPEWCHFYGHDHVR